MADEVVPQPTGENKPPRGRNLGLVITGFGIILLLAVGGFYLYTRMNSSNSSNQAETTSSTVEETSPAPTGPATNSVIRYQYSCTGNKTIDARYENNAETAILVLSDGRTMTLGRIPSGSGVQYSNSDGTIVLATKGNSATLTENGKQTYSDCNSGS